MIPALLRRHCGGGAVVGWAYLILVRRDVVHASRLTNDDVH
jgi:hypothetical protein